MSFCITFVIPPQRNSRATSAAIARANRRVPRPGCDRRCRRGVSSSRGAGWPFSRRRRSIASEAASRVSGNPLAVPLAERSGKRVNLSGARSCHPTSEARRV
jgi:hypothetical protein